MIRTRLIIAPEAFAAEPWGGHQAMIDAHKQATLKQHLYDCGTKNLTEPRWVNEGPGMDGSYRGSWVSDVADN